MHYQSVLCRSVCLLQDQTSHSGFDSLRLLLLQSHLHNHCCQCQYPSNRGLRLSFRLHRRYLRETQQTAVPYLRRCYQGHSLTSCHFHARLSRQWPHRFYRKYRLPYTQKCLHPQNLALVCTHNCHQDQSLRCHHFLW